MRFDNIGVPLNVLQMMSIIVVALFLSIMLSSPEVHASLSVEKTTTSSSMWFRPEPNQPRKKDMKVGKLNRLIGSDYDEIWMSKTPIAGNTTTSTYDADKSETTEPDNLQLPEQLPAQYQEMVRSWLTRRGTCSVEYTWTDLGKSFWPRWIKTGRCSRSETSCSWPPGMSCMPSSVKVLNLLRWHCWLKNRKNKKKNLDKKKNIELAINNTAGDVIKDGKVNLKKKKKKNDKFRCLWIKVPYPVTEYCTCSCKKPDE